MKLSAYNKKTLMLFLQQKIEEHAEFSSEQLVTNSNTDFLTYPPNGGLTNNEILSLQKLKDDSILKSALRKVFANNSAGVIFDLLNVIDGTSDPDENLGKWTMVSIIDQTMDIEETGGMLHDDLYDKYWDWRNIRPKKGWKLDIYNG